jgi:hypothetical protein
MWPAYVQEVVKLVVLRLSILLVEGHQIGGSAETVDVRIQPLGCPN